MFREVLRNRLLPTVIPRGKMRHDFTGTNLITGLKGTHYTRGILQGGQVKHTAVSLSKPWSRVGKDSYLHAACSLLVWRDHGFRKQKAAGVDSTQNDSITLKISEKMQSEPKLVLLCTPKSFHGF